MSYKLQATFDVSYFAYLVDIIFTEGGTLVKRFERTMVLHILNAYKNRIMIRVNESVYGFKEVKVSACDTLVYVLKKTKIYM